MKRKQNFTEATEAEQVLTVLYLRTMKTQALVLATLLILVSFVVNSNCAIGPCPIGDCQPGRKREMLLDKVGKIFH